MQEINNLYINIFRIEMQAPQKQVHIRLTMGQDKSVTSLLHVLSRFTSGSEDVNALKNEINFPHKIGEDLIFAFIFGVQPGREKECINYIEQGMTAKDEGNTDNLSPMQMLMKRPISQGNVSFESFPGKVILTYKFPSENIEDIDEDLGPMQNIHFNFSGELQLKGHVAHNNKNRTKVKIDYSSIEIDSEKILPSQILETLSGFEPDLAENPMFQMIGKAKKIDLEMHTHSFRKIKQFFEKAKETEHQTKDFPYTAPGILKSKAEFALFFKEKYGFHMRMDYHSEEVFLRLIKVYSMFLVKGLDIPIFD